MVPAGWRWQNGPDSVVLIPNGVEVATSTPRACDAAGYGRSQPSTRVAAGRRPSTAVAAGRRPCAAVTDAADAVAMKAIANTGVASALSRRRCDTIAVLVGIEHRSPPKFLGGLAHPALC